MRIPEAFLEAGEMEELQLMVARLDEKRPIESIATDRLKFFAIG
jgi:hypothetical protein